MSWQRMRTAGQDAGSKLPGERGRYLVWLEPPYVEKDGHYVHFSWKEGSFCLRDYIHNMERRQGPDLTAQQVWLAAKDRIPCKGELYMPVENSEFWAHKLTELTEHHKNSSENTYGTSLWSRVSTKFTSKSRETKLCAEDEAKADDVDVLSRFKLLWIRSAGCHVVDGTVGYSARYRDEPLLWVYPTYFQVAPRGKRNSRHDELMEMRDRYFPELSGKSTIPFDSEYFQWDRLARYAADIQESVRRATI